MDTINQKEYDDWKLAQGDDPYGLECFNYAERWANLMEKAISKGKKLGDVAEDLSHKADTSGITGFMYGMAVSILSQCWIRGEELRRWSNLNLQIGDEGERANEEGGVLNPTLLSISKK